MSIFDIDQDVEVQAAQDFDGKRTVDTGVYTGKIKLAYLDKSKGGANSVNLQLDVEGKTVNFTEYVTSGTEKGCKNYYLDKKTGAKRLLPGMQNMNNLALAVSGSDLSKQTIESKVIKIWDFDLKKEAPVKRDVITSLNGKDIVLAIQEIQENKYSDPTQAVTKNEIVKVLITDTKQTLAEEEASKDAAWADNWEAKNKGVLKDNFKAPEPTEGAEVDFEDDAEGEDIFGG